jgi:putative membrane protein
LCPGARPLPEWDGKRSIMADPTPSPASHDRATELAEQRTELAFERTRIAADRTLMAWIRTALSMITFGFTLYKFLEAFREAEHLAFRRPNSPRNLGLALIGVGTAALIVATIQHYQSLKRLQGDGRQSIWTLTIIVALFIILIGILAFVGVWLRAGPF